MIRHILRWVLLNTWAIPVILILMFGFWLLGDRDEIDDLSEFLMQGLVIGDLS